MATAIKLINGPHITTGSYRAGEDIVEGLAYTPDVYGVLTKAGTTTVKGVFPAQSVASGYLVRTREIGHVPCKLGTGGATEGNALKYGANGTMVVGTVGTDHIVGTADQTGIEGDLISMMKTA